MTKTAFIFSGQGAQKIGMARDLYDSFDSVRATFARASELLGYDLRALIDEDEAKLNETEYTQPAIFVTSVAILRLLEEKGLKPDIVAGLSLGEYTALTAAGVLDFDSAVPLIAKRGKFMAEAAPSGSGKMVAVLGTEAALIEEVCKKASVRGIVSPANYNTPQQIVIGGEAAAVDFAVTLLKEEGVRKMIPLKVSGPFHTAILEPASIKLAAELEKVELHEPKIPVISNTTAQVEAFADVKTLLTRQIKEPVRWYDSVATMQALGVTKFVEVGPGKVLSGFIKKISPSAELANVENLESFEKLLNQA